MKIHHNNTNLIHFLNKSKRLKEYSLYLSLKKQRNHFIPFDNINVTIENTQLTNTTFYKYMRWLVNNNFIEIHDKGYKIVAHNKIIRKYFPDLEIPFMENKETNHGIAKYKPYFKISVKDILAELRTGLICRHLKFMRIKAIEGEDSRRVGEITAKSLHIGDYISASLAGRILNLSVSGARKILTDLNKRGFVKCERICRVPVRCKCRGSDLYNNAKYFAGFPYYRIDTGLWYIVLGRYIGF